MVPDWEQVYDRLRSWAEAHGIRVGRAPMDAGTAGKFDGLSVTLNGEYDPQERCYYFAHALGSIAQWGLAPRPSQAVFNELHAARAARRQDPGRLERAVERHQAFEERSSGHAAWLLGELGYRELVPSYTNFARADLESIRRLHLEGAAPVWREFFAEWNRQVLRGERKIAPLEPRPIPPFRPVRINTQEIVQEADDDS